MHHDRTEHRRAPGGGSATEGAPGGSRPQFRCSVHCPEYQVSPVAARCARKLVTTRLFALVELYRAKAWHRFPLFGPFEAVPLLGQLSPSPEISPLPLRLLLGPS